MTTQTVACAGFGKEGQIERVWGTSLETEVPSVIQGAKPWQGSGGLCPPEAVALLNFMYEI